MMFSSSEYVLTVVQSDKEGIDGGQKSQDTAGNKSRTQEEGGVGCKEEGTGQAYFSSDWLPGLDRLVTC